MVTPSSPIAAAPLPGPPAFFVRLYAALALLLLAGTASARPSFVVVMTDDMSVPMLYHMPLTRRLVGGAGTEFRQAFVSTALCCPSRATFLTGRYASNHGVKSNHWGGRWGFEIFDDAETLPVWLRRAGYRTGLVGKYLNGYQQTAPGYVPPGWSEWDARDASDDALTAKALAFIGQAGGQPFFLFVGYSAPHKPRTPAARHAALFPSLKAPRTPAWCEDVRDKPDLINFTTCSATNVVKHDAFYRDAARSLQAVDEGVAAIVAAVPPDTYVIFTSDHGNHFLDHRLWDGKDTGYETDIRVPLLISGPGIPRRVDNGAMILNSDLAPTVLGLADLPVPASVDGSNAEAILRGNAPASPRRAFPLLRWRGENWESRDNEDFRGVRTRRWKWIEWAGGARELYDLEVDPYETSNLAGDPGLAALRDDLERLTGRLAACAGAACRVIEREATP